MTTESDLQKTHAATTELNLAACVPHIQFALKSWHFVSTELASESLILVLLSCSLKQVSCQYYVCSL